MIKKIMTGLVVAAATTLMVSFSIPTFNQTTVKAAGKVLSMEDVADKVIKTAHKAYDQKKKITTSVTIECPGKQSVEKYKNKLFKIIAKNELEEFYDVTSSFYGNLEGRTGMTWSENNGKMSSDYKNGKLTIKFINKGNNKGWRSLHENIIYGKQNMRELYEVTEGMSEMDKAWRIAVWLMVDHKTKYRGVRSEVAAYEKDVAMNRAQGLCDTLAGLYIRYASRMGIKAGHVSANDHRVNCVVIDGKVYYLEMQDIEVEHGTWLSAQGKDYNDENVDASATLKYVPDPTGRWLKVPQVYAEAMEEGSTTVYPWEVSESEYCLMAEKQAKITLAEGWLGKPSKWKYSENIKKYI